MAINGIWDSNWGQLIQVTGVFTNSWISYIINTYHERIEHMTTKREYLASKGITVGRRGRFSAAAKQALSEAESNGVKFTAEVKQPKK